jgi:hypothetical protein
MRSNVLSLVIKNLDKNNKVIVDIMEHMNFTQLEMKKHRNKVKK